ncbi:hypothetical protein SRABI106_04628 [Rahnella aquatilis]|nr:hypothetical protein SRABI106_04628 [Rahnella aquatilis]
MILQRFDITEDVIPATTVQSDNVIAQVVKDFAHLENRRQGFNQHRGFNRAPRQSRIILGKTEDLAPPVSLMIRLHFWQIEIGATAFCQ